jgi:hypothetical protein
LGKKSDEKISICYSLGSAAAKSSGINTRNNICRKGSRINWVKPELLNIRPEEPLKKCKPAAVSFLA